MNIVIDTNVFLSAVMWNRLPQEVLSAVIDQPEWQWVGTKEIIAEYFEVISRQKFEMDSGKLTLWNKVVNEAVALFEAMEPVNHPADETDAKFLECALAASAGVVLTGDKGLLAVEKFRGTDIMTVRDFHDRFVAD